MLIFCSPGVIQKGLSAFLFFVLVRQCQAQLVTNASASAADGQAQCVRPFLDQTQKQVYRVGVLAIRGRENAYKEFNKTFSDYLTATVGSRFDPPIAFELKPLNFVTLFSDVEEKMVDFIYVNPSAFSCIESEHGANTLVTQISKRRVAVGGENKVFHLTKFGGVIIARADNANVNSIRDIKGKSVACASISGLGSGQMQVSMHTCYGSQSCM